MSTVSAWLAVAMTVLLTVYGQVVIKMRIAVIGPMGDSIGDQLTFIRNMLLDPWVLSGFVGAFLASLCWMMAMTRLPISLAYPFTSMAFVLVVAVGAIVFHERVNLTHMIGIAMVVGGLIVISQA